MRPFRAFSEKHLILLTVSSSPHSLLAEGENEVEGQAGCLHYASSLLVQANVPDITGCFMETFAEVRHGDPAYPCLEDSFDET